MVTVRFYSGPAPRPKPKAGDRRTTKAHGLQVRVQAMATHPGSRAPIGRVVCGSRPVFEWVKPENVEPWDDHLLTPEELERVKAKRVRVHARLQRERLEGAS